MSLAHTSLDPSHAARLQQEAERNPRAYRIKLALLALFGDIALTLAQVLPFALPILIGVLWINQPVFYAMGAAAILFFAWLMRPQVHLTGRPVSPDEAPALFAALDALRSKLDVRGRMEVQVDEEFNASALETPGFLGIGKRRVLTLGMPLLVTLTSQQLLAVIAHEFGHFSRRHGRFGHWLYRARAGWLDYMQQIDESTSPLERAAAAFAQHFVPYFSVRSFVYSRSCEYEADRDAALAVGESATADALSRIAILGHIWHDGVPREITRLQTERDSPPADLYGHFAAAASRWSKSSLQAYLERELAIPSGWTDTHPALSERLQSIGQEARIVAAATTSACAGADFFGSAWPRLLDEFNKKWLSRIGPEWLIVHLRWKHVLQPQLDAPESIAATDVGRRLARGRALRLIAPAEGLAALRELHSEYPGDPSIQFALGAALLNEGDASGVALLESIAKADARFRSPSYERIARFVAGHGDPAQAERWLNRFERSLRYRQNAASDFWDAVDRKEAGRTTLADVINVLADALHRDACIKDAWLMERTVPLATDQAASAVQILVRGLVLRIDTQETVRRATHYSEIAAHYEWALSVLAPPEDHVTVRTSLTTEPEKKYDEPFRVIWASD